MPCSSVPPYTLRKENSPTCSSAIVRHTNATGSPEASTSTSPLSMCGGGISAGDGHTLSMKPISRETPTFSVATVRKMGNSWRLIMASWRPWRISSSLSSPFSK